MPGLPPTVNHAWRPNGRGGKIQSKEYEAYIQAMRLHVRTRLWGWKPVGPLALVLEFMSPRFITRKGLPSLTMDVDNRVKTVIDMLHGGRRSPGVIACDDALYWHISAFKIPCEGMETTIVSVYDLGRTVK